MPKPGANRNHRGTLLPLPRKLLFDVFIPACQVLWTSCCLMVLKGPLSAQVQKSKPAAIIAALTQTYSSKKLKELTLRCPMDSILLPFLGNAWFPHSMGSTLCLGILPPFFNISLRENPTLRPCSFPKWQRVT